MCAAFRDEVRDFVHITWALGRLRTSGIRSLRAKCVSCGTAVAAGLLGLLGIPGRCRTAVQSVLNILSKAIKLQGTYAVLLLHQPQCLTVTSLAELYSPDETFCCTISSSCRVRLMFIVIRSPLTL